MRRSPRSLTVSVAALTAAGALVLTACNGATDDADALDVWIMEGTNPDASDFFDDVAADFEEQTGAEVNVEFVPWADAHDRFVTGMAGDELPDVAEVGTTWTPEFAETGAMADLTDRIDDPDDYVPELIEAAEVEDGIYGVPWHAAVRSIIYRTDIFEDLDLDEPQDWDELRAAAIAIDESEAWEETAFPVPGHATHSISAFIWGAGGDFATENPDGSWDIHIDSAESQEGLQYLADLALEDDVSTTGATTWMETDILDNFNDENVAMTVQGGWTIPAILEDNPDLEGRIGAFMIPGPDGEPSPSFVGGSHLGVFEGADQDLSWEFIELLTEEEYSVRWSEESGYFPPNREQLTQFEESDDDLVAPFAQQMSQAGAVYPVTPAWGDVEGDEVFPRMMQDILSEDATVAEATSTAAEELDEFLNQDD
ncbi:sugar ABC transporter substrate-binding protein [Lipingzhangella sp. LS1_29]|uniref:Sugar ABC transporter substrate-binding protein n=1 Tax=Lipingzhangella rawalii TaxID=2055835 RepID=A0ABU2H9J3_9ACTN|nr:sugar ABC transporter substrate-binding protein [Lipingzhangella rawalii]MDS1271988.1 sugar ABC transporter substrate-binding protein [Lipingzhangella rawalii]